MSHRFFVGDKILPVVFAFVLESAVLVFLVGDKKEGGRRLELVENNNWVNPEFVDARPTVERV